MENETFYFEIFNGTSYVGIVSPDEPIPIPIPVGQYSDLMDEECGELSAEYLDRVKACNFWSGVLILVVGIFALFCNVLSIHVFMR